VAAFAEAGNRGPNIRSDAYLRIEPTDTGGIVIDLKSKVSSLYGKTIQRLLHEGLKHYNITAARVTVEDSGALPFVLMARLETAVKRLNPQAGDFLPPLKAGCQYTSKRDRFRRSRLYLPGNQPKFMINAGLHKPDGVILDLEDSVSANEKDAARILVRNALRSVDFYGAERMVRVNPGEMGMQDISAIIAHNVHLLLIPKAEDRQTIQAFSTHIEKEKQRLQVEQDIFLMPIIESAKGVLNAYEIAAASPMNVALAIGLEDYTKDICTSRSADQKESFLARSMVVNAARACGLQPIDTVFSDVTDMAGLRASVREAKQLGFDGKGCIHPRQIHVIHDAFAPTEAEITKAKAVYLAFEKAKARGLGVVSLGSKMIDPPVVKRALKTIDMAVSYGLLAHDWQKGEEQ